MRAGGRRLADPVQHSQKHERIIAMSAGAAMLAPDLYRAWRLRRDPVDRRRAEHHGRPLQAMKALPIGAPKLMVSTVASGRRTFEPLVGSKDIVLMPAVADIAGINVLTRTILEQCGWRDRRDGHARRTAASRRRRD